MDGRRAHLLVENGFSVFQWYQAVRNSLGVLWRGHLSAGMHKDGTRRFQGKMAGTARPMLTGHLIWHTRPISFSAVLFTFDHRHGTLRRQHAGAMVEETEQDRRWLGLTGNIT